MNADEIALAIATRLRLQPVPCPHGFPEAHVVVSAGVEGPCQVLCDACVMEAVRTEVAPLLAEVGRLRATACQQPTATQCVRLWESDHQGRALEEYGLLEEYGHRGCDAIDAVCADLVHARKLLSATKTEPPEAKHGP